jgi:hypothetical protein
MIMKIITKATGRAIFIEKEKPLTRMPAKMGEKNLAP